MITTTKKPIIPTTVHTIRVPLAGYSTTHKRAFLIESGYVQLLVALLMTGCY